MRSESLILRHDFPQDLLDDLALYYGIAYLDSLGFRYRDGTLKAAWDVLLKEAESAGFRYFRVA